MKDCILLLVGFLGLLALLFIGLKLGGVMRKILHEQPGWSWWWVLLPLYGPLLVGIGAIVVAVVISVLLTAWRRA